MWAESGSHLYQKPMGWHVPVHLVQSFLATNLGVVQTMVPHILYGAIAHPPLSEVFTHIYDEP